MRSDIAGDQADLELRHLQAKPRTGTFRSGAPTRSHDHTKTTEFILSGFHQEDGIRYYMFQRASDGRDSAAFTVDADMKLLRKYGIGLQELPLLCRHLLEKQDVDSSATAVTFSEDLMKEQADQRAAVKYAAQQKKKVYRRRSPNPPGQDFRGLPKSESPF